MKDHYLYCLVVTELHIGHTQIIWWKISGLTVYLWSWYFEDQLVNHNHSIMFSREVHSNWVWAGWPTTAKHDAHWHGLPLSASGTTQPNVMIGLEPSAYGISNIKLIYQRCVNRCPKIPPSTGNSSEEKCNEG